MARKAIFVHFYCRIEWVAWSFIYNTYVCM